MADVQIAAVPRGNASNSRPAGVRQRDGGPSWLGPLRRTRYAILASLRMIESSGKVVDACEGFAGRRPLRATRQLEHVSARLVKVTARLQRGVDSLNEANYRLALSPFDAGDAPGRLIEATERWIDAATRLAVLSNRLDDTFSGVLDDVKGGDAPLDLDELLGNDGPTPRRITTHSRVATLVSLENSRIFCIHLRRRRSPRLTVAEAPKRVSRGRAPPIVSTCPL